MIQWTPFLLNVLILLFMINQLFQIILFGINYLEFYLLYSFNIFITNQYFYFTSYYTQYIGTIYGTFLGKFEIFNYFTYSIFLKYLILNSLSKFEILIN